MTRRVVADLSILILSLALVAPPLPAIAAPITAHNGTPKGLTEAAVSAESQVFFSATANLTHNPSDTLSYSSQIVVDASGNINALWADYNCPPTYPYTCNFHLFFSRSTDGGASFSAPKDISNHTSSDASYLPQMAVDAAGNINVVWEDTAFGGWEIVFSRSTDGGATFSIPKNVSKSYWAANPQIALDAQGNINVVWQTEQFYNYGWNVSFIRSTDGGRSFSDPKDLCSNGEDCEWPQVAVDASGNINVVWAKALCYNCYYDVFFSRSNDGGITFSAPQNLSSSTESLITAPGLLLETGGNISVVWSKGNWGEVESFFSRSRNGGVSFSTPKTLPGGEASSHFPRLAAGPVPDDLNVAWANDGNIFFSRSTDGGATFSSPKAVASTTGSLNYMVVDRTGAINLVWQDVEAFAGDILFSRSTDGGATFSAPYNLAKNSGASYSPEIALDASGNIYVVWYDETTGIQEIFFARGTTVSSLQGEIAELPVSAFKNKSHQRAMFNILANVTDALDDGDSTLAVSELQALLQHVNGCRPSADSNDWVVDCTAQRKIRTSIDILIAGLGG